MSSDSLGQTEEDCKGEAEDMYWQVMCENCYGWSPEICEHSCPHVLSEKVKTE